MGKSLNPNHMEDLRSSGLTDETINALGFHSGNAAEVKVILGFAAGPGLVIPYPCGGGGEPYWRIKPDQPLVIDGHPAKYLSPKGAIVRAYIPPKTCEALKDPTILVLITEGGYRSNKSPCCCYRWEAWTEKISILATRFTLLILAALAIKGYEIKVCG